MSLSLHAPSISRPRTTVVAMSLAWPISLMVSWWAGKGSQKTAQKNVGKKGFPCSTYPRGSVGLVYLPTCTMKNQPNVGKYTSPMDPLGNNPRWFQWILRNLFAHFEQWKAPPRNGINRGQKMATEQRFGHFRWREYSLLMVGKKQSFPFGSRYMFRDNVQSLVSFYGSQIKSFPVGSSRYPSDDAISLGIFCLIEMYLKVVLVFLPGCRLKMPVNLEN